MTTTRTTTTKTTATSRSRAVPRTATRMAAMEPAREVRPAPAHHRSASTSAPHRGAPVKKESVHTASHTQSAPSASKTTTNHNAIRQWAERRGGHPTSVSGTEHGKESAGVLRLDFGVKDEKLHSVDWNAFFDKFEEAKLAFLYQDKTSDGKMSRLHKFIHWH